MRGRKITTVSRRVNNLFGGVKNNKFVAKLSRFVKTRYQYVQHLYKQDRLTYRLAMGFVAVLLTFTIVLDVMNSKGTSDKYDISKIETTILDEPIQLYGQKLVSNLETGSIVYNEGYQAGSDVAGQNSAPKFTAEFNTDGDNGVEVTDAVSGVSFSVVPKFGLLDPIKDQNRVVQPLLGKNATKIFTLKGTAIKEDLVLFDNQGDELEFDYDLVLPENTEAQIEGNGSVGVYGISSELLGQISVGSDDDQELLDKLRSKQDRNNLLFTIPAPFIVEASGNKTETARTWFSMPTPNTLRVHAVGLDDATYPLSIDPSIYIETARKLMRGNAETNIDFDTTNELIQKGSTTGARFDDWDNTTQLNDGRWNGATAVAGGFIYSAGGSTEGGLVETTFATPTTGTTYTVPAGVTSVTIKSWGAGGGGGGSSPDRDGGAGGGGGYAGSTITVTPAENLTVRVGGGGAGGTGNGSGTNSGNGGGGGGYSGVYRGGTALIVASGGGGGGGGNGDTGSTARQPGDDGGAGGGTTGVTGDGNGTTTGGGGGTPTTGGAGGTSSGSVGASVTGGDGGSNGANQANGGINGGGDGGTQQNAGGPNKLPGGGGGGSGYFGAGGGGLADSQYNGGGGGGGGSSYTTGSPSTNATGAGQDPGNKNDADRNGYGDGAAGGTSGGTGSTGDGGYVTISYSAGGAGAVQEELYWAQLNDTTGTVDSPNPGDGSCVNWCTSSVYDLPSELQGHTMTTYNGFLYVFGGENDSGTRQEKVYIAKLGANGEPSLWHPTDTNENNWVYWYTDGDLSTERTYHSTVAYNNKMYLLGGQTDASTGGVTTVEVADIQPTGILGTWATTGMTVLPSARYSHTVEVYNDYMYLIGGNSSGTLQSSVSYSKLADDGTMSSWYTTEAFTDARMTWGGRYSTVWGGYLYLQGGCSSIAGGTGYCNTVEGDTQIASINADGTITDWNTIQDLNNLRIGHSLVAWRNNIYGIGGCTSQNPIDGQCADLILTNDYGSINQDGDASTVSDSVDIGVGTCTGADPFDCDSPPLGNSNGEGGQMAGGVVINNGFVYYIGGCRSVGGSGQICTNGSASRTTDTIYYAEIANDGTLRRPATCTGTNIQYAGSWCVDNSNTINGSVGLAGFGHTVFNNTIYAIGGTDGATWQSDVYRVTLNADGSLNSWASQTQSSVGLGTGSIGYPYVFTRANPSSAGTNPGNLYVIGGCNGIGSGLDCDNTFFSTVYKCNIATAGTLNGCTTTGQTQLDSEPGTGGSQGLGIMAGTEYANYIYLIGGQSDNEDERGEVMYAKIDDSNNIVDADGETAIDDIWETSGNSLTPARRRGIAFGYNGYLYGLAGFAVDTGLNDLLFAKIDVSDGSIGTFTESGVTVNQRWDLRGVVSSGFVYTLGGCSSGSPPATCNSMTATVQTFQLYNNFSGSTSDYTSSTNDFATDRIGGATAIYNGNIYIAGGCTGTSDCSSPTTSVQYAALGEDGSIGSWSATTAGLPAARGFGKLVEVGGTLYYLGGETATTERAEIYYAVPTGSGDTTSWSTASYQIPQARSRFGAAVWNNRIYITGGLNTSGNGTTSVYYSEDLSSGGDLSTTFTTATGLTPAFNVARNGHVTIAYANNLYVIGGKRNGVGSSYLSDVQFTKINSDGSIEDAWTYTTSLPQSVEGADGFAVNGYMYIFGGRSGSTTCTDNTYITPISANTSIASGNNPTGIGSWYQTREALDGGDRYGSAVAYNEGKAYVLGGACDATLSYTGADRTLYATLFSQPQVSRYSRFIDTDSNVFPNSWLLNGVDNDIGARWYTTYVSSTQANNSWGLTTDYGDTTLGDVAVYTPIDGSGTDTDFARWYYFTLSVDASQTYGYPDDVTRGPTIDDLSLFFTSDPNKRLRHGKTFTGGEQQPLDTPCRQSEDSDCPLP